jgi:hypothetical protein
MQYLSAKQSAELAEPDSHWQIVFVKTLFWIVHRPKDLQVLSRLQQKEPTSQAMWEVMVPHWQIADTTSVSLLTQKAKQK